MSFSIDQFYRDNRRTLIWIILFGLLWLMRDFFGLIFLTFILAFIATPLARLGQRYLHLSRRVSIVTVYICFLAALVSFAALLTPRAIKEANTLLASLPQTQEKLLEVKSNFIARYPQLSPVVTGYLRGALPDKKEAEVAARIERETAAVRTAEDAAATSETVTARHTIEDEILVKELMNDQANKLREMAPEVFKTLWRLTATMMLALLFSFLITLDFTRLSAELQSLRNSRLHEFYAQVAQPVVRFAYVLGRSFQAQAAIACLNAALTLVGMLVLGVPSVAMLTLIVFLCSFIPVLGVFISTTPIVLVALNSGGLSLALWVVVMVIVIHAIEAYLLNPIIYGKHLKLNPVLVLMILFVGHHAFGLWGMLLGVPVAYYFIHDVFGVPVWGERRIAPRGQVLSSMTRREGGEANPAPAAAAPEDRAALVPKAPEESTRAE